MLDETFGGEGRKPHVGASKEEGHKGKDKGQN